MLLLALLSLCGVAQGFGLALEDDMVLPVMPSPCLPRNVFAVGALQATCWVGGGPAAPFAVQVYLRVGDTANSQASPDTSFIAANVTIPPTGNVTLKYSLWPSCSGGNLVKVSINALGGSELLSLFADCPVGQAWLFGAHDLSQFKGQTVQLVFAAVRKDRALSHVGFFLHAVNLVVVAPTSPVAVTTTTVAGRLVTSGVTSTTKGSRPTTSKTAATQSGKTLRTVATSKARGTTRATVVTKPIVALTAAPTPSSCVTHVPTITEQKSLRLVVKSFMFKPSPDIPEEQDSTSFASTHPMTTTAHFAGKTSVSEPPVSVTSGATTSPRATTTPRTVRTTPPSFFRSRFGARDLFSFEGVEDAEEAIPGVGRQLLSFKIGAKVGSNAQKNSNANAQGLGGPAGGPTDLPCDQSTIEEYGQVVSKKADSVLDFLSGSFQSIKGLHCNGTKGLWNQLKGFCPDMIKLWQSRLDALNTDLKQDQLDVAFTALMSLRDSMGVLNDLCQNKDGVAPLSDSDYNFVHDKFCSVSKGRTGVCDEENGGSLPIIDIDLNASLTKCSFSKSDFMPLERCAPGTCEKVFSDAANAGTGKFAEAWDTHSSAFEDCVEDNPFRPCKLSHIEHMSDAAVGLLEALVSNLVQFASVRCVSSSCTLWREFVMHWLLDVAYEFASYCGSSDCIAFCQMLADLHLEHVTECNGAECAEAIKVAESFFARDFVRSFARVMNGDALVFARSHCTSEDCFARNNASVAMYSFVKSAVQQGFAFNESAAGAVGPVMDQLRMCEAKLCSKEDVAHLRGSRRSFIAAASAWEVNVSSIMRACGKNPACTGAAAAPVASANRVLDMTTYKIAMPAFIAVEAVVLVLAVAVFVAAFVLHAVSEHGFYMLLLAGLVITALVRVMFYHVALVGWGVNLTGFYSELCLLLLDKLASIFFALSILAFLYLWVKMVHEHIYPSKAILAVASVAAIVLAAGLAATSLAYVIFATTRNTLVSQFFGTSFLDGSDLVLSAFLLFSAFGLLVYSLLTLRFVIGLNKDFVPKIQQQVAACRRMTLVVLALVLLFALRFALIYYAHFNDTVSVGLELYYGLGALLPEAAGTGAILYVVFVLFWQYRAKVQKSTIEPLIESSTERASLLIGYDF